MSKISTEKEYITSLNSLIQTIEQIQVKTVLSANALMLWAYWSIGSELSLKIKSNKWGAKIIDNYSKDLKQQFPTMKGLSTRNLVYMRQFAENYPIERIVILNEIWEQVKSNSKPLVNLIESIENKKVEITQPVVAQLEETFFINSIIGKISWSHHLVLLNKVPEMPKRFWYMLNTLEHGISKNILSIQVETGLYERQINDKKVNNFSATLPKPQSDFANYLIKDPYIFDFVQAKENADERNIEEQLTKHITKFLLELGQGFSFVGKQYHLNVGGSDFYIDLLFYHIKLHCYVVVELKAREFKPGDPAQLNFYINVINDTLKTDKDNDTIGILLCKGKNEVLAEYALKGYNNPISVSDYELSKSIPEELKSTLPQIDDLEQELNTIKVRNE
jgi:predicted nuclease of restriction endonuclease-like (RecB) superfamily